MYLLLNVGGGFVLGLSFGWGTNEALVIAGAVGISSSAIVTKLLIELRRLANPESRLILGIIVVEDVFLALYLALLQPALGDAHGFTEAASQFAIAFAFLVALGCTARWGAGVVGRLVATPDDELLTVMFLGVAVLVAGFAEELGVSDAIGAFMAGLVLAESPVAHRIERLVLPLRDAFAALFFFAFGLTIDPGDALAVAIPVTIAVILSIVLNVTAGILAARLQGFNRAAAANIGLTILGRGEFSLILATLAVAAGLDEQIGPFVALYVLVLAVLGPLLAARSTLFARLLPARWFASPRARR
jgi:CPA2 family monovalent cation:H+ antiporter-2